MKKVFIQKIICGVFFSISSLFINAQKVTELKKLQEVISSVDSFNTKLPAEQLYLHLDKTNYSIGDTVWFKAYLLQRSTHAYSPLSGILYVELISDSNRLIKRLSFSAAYGLSWGQIALDKADVTEGNFFIRAYTNWMQNFGEKFFYKRSININAPLTTNWLIKENHTIANSSDKTDIDFTLQLTNIDYSAEKLKDIDVKIIQGKKILYRQELQTNQQGILTGKFSLPLHTEAKDLVILLNDKNNQSLKSIVPLIINRPEKIDLQFMPEGGYLVAGMSSKMGFKAINENGIGITVEGKIINSKNIEVASFKSIHRGMGSLHFTPQKNETYTALVNVPGATTMRFSLPPIKNTGIVLHFENEKNADSIRLQIKISPELVDNNTYHLIGLSRGIVCYGAKIIFRNTEINAVVSKKLFPSGIAHFSLLNAASQPLNERMLFINHSDNLAIKIQSYKNNFFVRDSVPLNIKITDIDGNPVSGSFSISVTDDGQVKEDNLTTENIVTRFLLTADLKGNIEAADYYTTNTDYNAWQALDALLLTQGWVGYEWETIMNPPTAIFKPEPKFSVRGRITNLINSPINKAHVVLMTPGARLNIKDTITNKNGEFIFTNFRKLDSLSFFLDARNAKDKKFGITMTIDQFKPAEIKPLKAWNAYPWYVNSDSTLVNFVQNKQRIEAELNENNKFKSLQEVKIKVKKVIKESANLNGAGNADQILDEADLEKESGKGKTLWQLLREKLKGFMDLGDGDIQQISNQKILYIVDGINLRNFGTARETLEALDVEDVKGIEVMNSPKYLSRYQMQFMTLAEQMSTTPLKYVFIEITTRSGNGIFFKKSPGLMIYKPLPITIAAQFYSPKYVTKNNTGTKDLRSTIYWNPNLITDKKGEAKTSFYAADTPTTYTIMIQGSNVNGAVGYKVENISVNK